MVRTQLARGFTESSRILAIAVAIVLAIQGKTPENGARTLLAAGLTKESENVRNLSLPSLVPSHVICFRHFQIDRQCLQHGTKPY